MQEDDEVYLDWLAGQARRSTLCYYSRVDLFADKLASQIPEADRELVNSRLLAEYNCYPVYLSDELADMHYNGEPKKRDRV